MAKLSGAVVVASFCCCVLFGVLAGRSVEASYYGAGVVEYTVRKEVEAAIKDKPSLGPALVRLLFHDCWVNGCDGSVLLDKTPYNSSYGTEKKAANNIGLDGFDLIDKIKAELNKAGADASCADILVFAARDATSVLSRGKINYAVAGGRKDGVRSSAAYADATLPGSTFSFEELKRNFAAQGFDQEDLVILSGAHSVGVCHYSSFAHRFSPSSVGEIDHRYQIALAEESVRQNIEQHTFDPAVKNNIRDMDDHFQTFSGYDAAGVDTTATGVLDNSYYTANVQNMVLLKSDWELTQDKKAFDDLKEYRDKADKWNYDFGVRMAKLSYLKPPAGQYVEISRKNCRVTNREYYY